MATYVLLHGGGMGGWTWRYVAKLLRAQGHDVFTPTYTGFGERIHLIGRDVSTATHVTDIVNVLAYEDLQDCIMVGHSYSGVVLPGIEAAAGDRIRQHIYVDALVTRTGESVVEAMGVMSAEAAAELDAMLARGEGPVGSGVHEQQRAMAKEHPHLMSPERQSWLLDHLSDMPLRCTVRPVDVGAEAVRKSVDYIAVTQTIMGPMHERARALGWSMHEMEGDHAIIAGDPDQIAGFLLARA